MWANRQDNALPNSWNRVNKWNAIYIQNVAVLRCCFIYLHSGSFGHSGLSGSFSDFWHFTIPQFTPSHPTLRPGLGPLLFFIIPHCCVCKKNAMYTRKCCHFEILIYICIYAVDILYSVTPAHPSSLHSFYLLFYILFTGLQICCHFAMMLHLIVSTCTQLTNGSFSDSWHLTPPHHTPSLGIGDGPLLFCPIAACLKMLPFWNATVIHPSTQLAFGSFSDSWHFTSPLSSLHPPCHAPSPGDGPLFSYSNAPLLRVSTAPVCSHSLEVTAIYPPHPFPLHFHAPSLTFSQSGKMPARQDWSSWGTVGDIWHDWWSEGIRTFFWLQGSSLLQPADQTLTLTTLCERQANFHYLNWCV